MEAPLAQAAAGGLAMSQAGLIAGQNVRAVYTSS
jgi:hypothetical protein